MKTRLVKGQLMAFTLLAVVSLLYGLVNYVGIQRLTGLGTYTVTADFENGSGVYESGAVTYRGVEVGRVAGIDLEGDLVRVRMQLRNDYRIPASAGAAIKSMSAIGEQYVDLIPSDDKGPYLRDGSAIPRSKTSVPIPTARVLDQTQTLLKSVSTDSLRTAIDETFQAVNGTGPALATLIDSSADLLALAQADIDPTLTLLSDAEPLLRTGTSVRTEIHSATRDLAGFTEQLAQSDEQVREVLEQGPATADTISGTLADLTTPLPVLLADLQTLGQVLRVDIAGVRQILVVYPALATALNSSFVGGGFQTNGDTMGAQIPLDVKLGNTENSPPCTEGYQGTVRRDPSDTGPAEVSANNYCRISPDNPKVVRGARNLPCASDPTVRTAEVANCPGGLPSTWPGMLAHPGDPAPGAAPQLSDPGKAAPAVPAPMPPPSTPAAITTPYAEYDGTFRGPDGITYVLGHSAQSVTQAKEYQGWQSLLIK
ncbi:MlaD family protein [Nocardia sp. NPDC050408]|uniref:MlaD family protein n=1 Tax=unclassified Nocardia TaxID=2637762 RepID=UPI0034497ED2